MIQICLFVCYGFGNYISSNAYNYSCHLLVLTKPFIYVLETDVYDVVNNGDIVSKLHSIIVNTFVWFETKICLTRVLTAFYRFQSLHTLRDRGGVFLKAVELTEVELDSLSLHHQLKGSETKYKLRKKKEKKYNVHSSLQRQDDGVNISQEVDSEGSLEES